MADVITRFKLETSQYDSKLRDAAKSLAAYSKQAEMAGKDFDKFSQGGVNAAKALGNIATSANNTKDKVKELVSAYNDAAKAYNKLTDEQKNSDFGRAMSQSLETLQGRIREAKAEMNDTGGILGKLTEKFTVNIDAIKLFSLGLQGAQAALGVAKDAFFKNEEQLDTWGRVVESSQSLYSGFLDALNTGDISGYLSRIGEITQAAQNAYNALDALNTFNAFNQINVEKTRTGMTESIADYRSGQGTKEQVKAAGEAYQKELRERQKLERQAYLDAVKKVATERGVSGQDLITALSGSYGSYESLKAIPMSGTRTKWTQGGMFGGSVSYEEAFPANRQEQLGAALRRLNDTELQSLQALGAQAERTGNEIAQVDKQLTRVLNGRQSSTGGGGVSGGGSMKTEQTEFQKNQQNINTLTQEYVRISDNATEAVVERQAEIRKEIGELEKRNNLLKLYAEQAQGKLQGGDISTSGLGSTNSLSDKDYLNVGAGLTQEAIEAANAWANAGKRGKDAWKSAAMEVANVGSALAGIQDPAAKIIGTVGQAIATVALGASEASLAAAQTGNPWVWAGFAAGAMAQMLAMISTIHSATGYSEGGMIKGNSYSGDNIMANGGMIGLNAGEVVLNSAQQRTLASQLQGGGSGGRIVGVLKGENMYLMVNRYTKRSGRGEIVTWGG